MQKDFNILLEWFTAYKLSVNAEKTKVMMFSNGRAQLTGGDLKINMEDVTLEEVSF